MYQRAPRRRVVRKPSGGMRAVFSGLGDYSSLGKGDCGSNQKYDPDYKIPGIDGGQCVTADQYAAYHKNDSKPSFWDNLLGGLAAGAKAATTPAPAPAPVIISGGGGMSTTTKIALGAGAVGLALVLITRR